MIDKFFYRENDFINGHEADILKEDFYLLINVDFDDIEFYVGKGKVDCIVLHSIDCFGGPEITLQRCWRSSAYGA